MSRLQRVAVGVVVGLAVSVATALAVFRDDEPDIILTPQQSRGTISVTIEGAVARPGQVQVPEGSRLTDVIAAAGGLNTDADVSGLYVGARVSAGQRVIVVQGSPPRPTPDAMSTAGSTPPVELEPAATPPVALNGHLINLNTADAALLETLPSIGPVLAQRIIEYRETNGPFATIDELVAIDGISGRIVEELRPLVTVDG